MIEPSQLRNPPSIHGQDARTHGDQNEFRETSKKRQEFDANLWFSAKSSEVQSVELHVHGSLSRDIDALSREQQLSLCTKEPRNKWHLSIQIRLYSTFPCIVNIGSVDESDRGCEMESSKIAIQNGSLSLSAEGSEAFVRDALQFWEKLLGSSAPSTASIPIEEQEPNNINAQKPNDTANGPSKFENVFDKVDDKLKIIAHIPGKTKAEQSRNVALVVLYGHLLLGVELVPSDTIRQACVDQGCYDSTNFAQYLKG